MGKIFGKTTFNGILLNFFRIYMSKLVPLYSSEIFRVSWWFFALGWNGTTLYSLSLYFCWLNRQPVLKQRYKNFILVDLISNLLICNRVLPHSFFFHKTQYLMIHGLRFYFSTNDFYSIDDHEGNSGVDDDIWVGS